MLDILYRFFIDNVKAKVFIKAKPVVLTHDQKYLKLQELNMDFNVQNIKMGIENIHNGNIILGKKIRSSSFIILKSVTNDQTP